MEPPNSVGSMSPVIPYCDKAERISCSGTSCQILRIRHLLLCSADIVGTTTRTRNFGVQHTCWQSNLQGQQLASNSNHCLYNQWSYSHTVECLSHTNLTTPLSMSLFALEATSITYQPARSYSFYAVVLRKIVRHIEWNKHKRNHTE